MAKPNEENLIAAQEPDAPEAVSYTHLDVYKRQGSGRALFTRA